MTNMYPETKTWNPFVGCRFGCIYCRPSFQQQLKRWAKNNCELCYNYVPHTHPERLRRIPSADIIFVCGDGDIAFCPTDFLVRVIAAIKQHNIYAKKSKKFYFQSKDPRVFDKIVGLLPPNAYILTTLETNRDTGYEKISKAPKPSDRFKYFLETPYPKKIVTIEPIMDFDLDILVDWIKQIKPEAVYIGYNSRPKKVRLPEPPLEKTKTLIKELEKFTVVIPKILREKI
ncbi:MAG: hypothetical protein Q6363_008110 [Candidatus Njordarchaeota archaeon]